MPLKVVQKIGFYFFLVEITYQRVSMNWSKMFGNKIVFIIVDKYLFKFIKKRIHSHQ